MNRKRALLFFLIASALLSFNLVSCNNSNTNTSDEENISKKTEESLKDGAEKIEEEAEKISNEGMDIVSKIKDTKMDYSEDNFEDDMSNRGFKLEETEDSKSFFSVSNDDFIVNGEKISVYEYNESDRAKLEADLRTISENGSNINGSEVKWTNGPHIYKKGRIVVLYDGNSSTILETLTEVLGIPLFSLHNIYYD